MRTTDTVPYGLGGRNWRRHFAHTTFVEFLATETQKLGLDVARERYTLPRWDAWRWEITIAPSTTVSSYSVTGTGMTGGSRNTLPAATSICAVVMTL
jgi:hypothetical protein